MATTTPNYGWDVPTSTDYVAQGAVAIETLGDDIDASLFSITGGKNVGLVPISITSFSGVSSVAVDNVFTSTFKNYRIVVNATNGVSTPSRAYIRIINNAGSVVSAGGSYRSGFNWWRNTTSASGTEASAASTLMSIAVANSYTYGLTIEATDPRASDPVFSGLYAGFDYSSVFNGFCLSSGPARGFQLFNDTGTMQGEIRVYGYRNS